MNQERPSQNPELPEDSKRRLEGLLKNAEERVARYAADIQTTKEQLESLGLADAQAAQLLQLQLDLLTHELGEWEKIRARCEDQIKSFGQLRDQIKDNLISFREGQDN